MLNELLSKAMSESEAGKGVLFESGIGHRFDLGRGASFDLGRGASFDFGIIELMLSLALRNYNE